MKRLSARLQIRLFDRDRRLIWQAAEMEGYTVSEFIRRVVLRAARAIVNRQRSEDEP